MAQLSECRQDKGRIPNRRQQISTVLDMPGIVSNKRAAEFVEGLSVELQGGPSKSTRPLFLPLLSGKQRLYVLTDISLVKWVLSDPIIFNRAITLESFADAFQLNSVFTTQDLKLYRDKREFFTRNVNRNSEDGHQNMLTKINYHVDCMLTKFDRFAGTAFIPRVEGMVMEAYADLFFDIRKFPNAEECSVLIRKIWQIKSLWNNVPHQRRNPYLRFRMFRLRRQLFGIIEDAQGLMNSIGSKVGNEMAHVYLSNGYCPGNLLNSLIPLYEAPAKGVNNALIELANSPLVQANLRDEIRQNSEDELEYSKSNKTLLHRVWLEVLRLYPPAANQTRSVTKNCMFPQGSKVVTVWGVFHRDSEVWGADADHFNPDRWLSATPEQKHHFNAFGSGAQRCVARNYASFVCRAILKRILECRKISNEVTDHGTSDIERDRGYSRGPDDESLLRFTDLSKEPVGEPTG